MLGHASPARAAPYILIQLFGIRFNKTNTNTSQAATISTPVGGFKPLYVPPRHTVASGVSTSTLSIG